MRQFATLICTMAGLLGVLSSSAAAQVHVDFGFGHGHHHGHHWHHDWHDHHYHWYPGYAYRPYVERVYVTPAPQPTYAQPSDAMTLQSTPNVSTARSAQPTPRANALPGTADRGIVIRNADDSEGSVYFLAGTTEYELAPGEAKTLSAGADAAIEYDRGGNFGVITEEVTAGAYEFAVTATGWDLKRQPDMPPRAASRMVRKNVLPDQSR